jgi:hypothetical protein
MTSSVRHQYPQGVGAESNMSLAIAKTWIPAREVEDADQRLNIAVVFTSVESTLTALKEAGTLASSLGARITLLVPQVVPHPLPLESPPVLVEFNERRFRVIADQAPVETRVFIYLCRDRLPTLSSVLERGSIVVLGGRKRRWWPTRDESLARNLRKAGFEVIFKETE